MRNKTVTVRRFQDIIESPSGVAKFKRIMAATSKPEVYLAYFKEALDRAYGKSAQSIEMEVNDVSKRPDAETLDEAIRSIGSDTAGNSLAQGQ